MQTHVLIHEITPAGSAGLPLQQYCLCTLCIMHMLFPSDQALAVCVHVVNIIKLQQPLQQPFALMEGLIVNGNLCCTSTQHRSECKYVNACGISLRNAAG